MGMFDALKRGLAKFKESAKGETTEAEFEVVAAKPAPPAPPKPDAPAVKSPAAAAGRAAAPAPPAPAAKPPTAAPKPAAPPAPQRELSDAEIDRLLDEELAELDDEPAASPAPRAETAAAAVARPAAVEPPRPAAPAPTPVPPPTVPRAPPAPAPAPREARPSTASQPPPAKAAPTAAPKPPAAPPAKGKTIDPARVEDLLFDLEVSLLEADVALPTVEAILGNLREALPKIRVASNDDIPAAVESALRAALVDVLSVERIDFDEWVLEQPKPVVVMFVGVNGTGKTTAIGRIAHRLKENGISCVMAAGDTFRAGAIEQLERHGQNLGLTVVKTQAGGDPAAVAYDALEHAKARKKDVVLLDTAGRMQTNTNLMDEMKKIKRIAKPAMIVFVGDSLAGNDAVDQAIQFDHAVGINAVVLTKVDTDAKGGAALSIAHAVGKPVLFLGVGQSYDDLIPYDPQWMVGRIFD